METGGGYRTGTRADASWCRGTPGSVRWRRGGGVTEQEHAQTHRGAAERLGLYDGDGEGGGYRTGTRADASWCRGTPGSVRWRRGGGGGGYRTGTRADASWCRGTPGSVRWRRGGGGVTEQEHAQTHRGAAERLGLYDGDGEGGGGVLQNRSTRRRIVVPRNAWVCTMEMGRGRGGGVTEQEHAQTHRGAAERLGLYDGDRGRGGGVTEQEHAQMHRGAAERLGLYDGDGEGEGGGLQNRNTRRRIVVPRNAWVCTMETGGGGGGYRTGTRADASWCRGTPGSVRWRRGGGGGVTEQEHAQTHRGAAERLGLYDGDGEGEGGVTEQEHAQTHRGAAERLGLYDGDRGRGGGYRTGTRADASWCRGTPGSVRWRRGGGGLQNRNTRRRIVVPRNAWVCTMETGGGGVTEQEHAQTHRGAAERLGLYDGDGEGGGGLQNRNTRRRIVVPRNAWVCTMETGRGRGGYRTGTRADASWCRGTPGSVRWRRKGGGVTEQEHAQTHRGAAERLGLYDGDGEGGGVQNRNTRRRIVVPRNAWVCTMEMGREGGVQNRNTRRRIVVPRNAWVCTMETERGGGYRTGTRADASWCRGTPGSVRWRWGGRGGTEQEHAQTHRGAAERLGLYDGDRGRGGYRTGTRADASWCRGTPGSVRWRLGGGGGYRTGTRADASWCRGTPGSVRWRRKGGGLQNRNTRRRIVVPRNAWVCTMEMGREGGTEQEHAQTHRGAAETPGSVRWRWGGGGGTEQEHAQTHRGAAERLGLYDGDGEGEGGGVQNRNTRRRIVVPRNAWVCTMETGRGGTEQEHAQTHRGAAERLGLYDGDGEGGGTEQEHAQTHRGAAERLGLYDGDGEGEGREKLFSSVSHPLHNWRRHVELTLVTNTIRMNDRTVGR